jgi:hypothetical protein
MSRIGFCGGTYTSQSVNADAQECINLLPEKVESEMGVSAMTLYSTPGLSQFNNPGGNQVRGNYTITTGPSAGRTFKVVDATLYEELANGNVTAIGNVGNDGSFVSFAACPQQLAIVSAGNLYSYQLATQQVPNIVAGTFTGLVAGPWQPATVTEIAFIDSFFFLLVASSQTVYSSNSFDATATGWSALQIKIINTYADNVIGMIADHRFLWMFGAKQTESDYDIGGFPFPLAPMPSGFAEQGCAAPLAISQLDNAIFLWGARNDQGQGIAYRTSGATFQRISTHAIETMVQQFPRISDAISFAYQENGHSIWRTTFPSAQVTLAYDVSTGLWHKCGFWNQRIGAYQAALPICHTFNFGKHLVGDRQSGRTYQMSSPVQAGGGWNFVTDNGAPIRRLRRAPHINVEHQWMRYNELEVYLETGLGPEPPLLDGAGNARGPQLMLRCSRNGGHTYGQTRIADCGQAGKYSQRASFRRLGRARDMVFEVSCSDPVPWRFIDAYVNPKTQPSPRKRLTHQMAEVA